MTEADLCDIATLEIGGSRGPKGWIEWSCRNYIEHGFGLWVIETHAGDIVGGCGLTIHYCGGAAATRSRNCCARNGFGSTACTPSSSALS